MGAVVLLIVLAIVLGVLGLVVKTLKWLIIVAVVLFLFGLLRGWMAGKRGA